jgi:hypothetical protein
MRHLKLEAEGFLNLSAPQLEDSLTAGLTWALTGVQKLNMMDVSDWIELDIRCDFHDCTHCGK